MPLPPDSPYNDSHITSICEQLAVGTPLREICRQPGMPSWVSVYNWIHAHEDIASRIAHARELGFDAIAENCLEIADDGSNDYMEAQGDNADAGWRANGDHIQRSKLRIETRLKLLAKWSPKYRDRQAHEHSGSLTLEQLVAGSANGPD